MKIGSVSLPLSGHLNPMTSLARKLQSRGSEVVFFGVPDVGAIIGSAELPFVPFGDDEYPVDSMVDALAPLSKLHGLEALEYQSEPTADRWVHCPEIPLVSAM